MIDTNADSDNVVFTVSFDAAVGTDPSITGGKGANLARLVSAGFTVPDGFCVSTAAYQSLIDDPETKQVIESLEELDPAETDRIEELSATVRERIKNAEFPDSVRQAIEATLVDFQVDAFAVRSSATAEDLPTASFAGQHETYLNVSSVDVLNRIRDCMASLYTQRAVTYRLRNVVPSSDVALAVVVQAMVDADVAGVLFTADPVTENRHVASIEANYGLGESIVAGDVSADNIRVDRESGEILSYDIGEKSIRVQSREWGGIEHTEVEADAHQDRALSEEQIHRLVEAGAEIEELFGSPQDIEWAFLNDELFILQSRPITSLYPLVTPLPADHLLHIYLSFGHQQAMPEALPPLVVDFWRSFIDNAVVRFREAEKGGLSAEAGNRVYVDLTPLIRIGPVRQRLPGAVSNLSEPAGDGLREVLRECWKKIPKRGRKESFFIGIQTIRRGRSWLRTVAPRILSQFTGSLVFGLPDLNELWNWSQSWGEAHAARIRSPETIQERVRTAFEKVDLTIFLKDIAPRGASVFPGIFAGRILRRMFPDAGDELDAIGKGFEDEVVTRMNQELGELADLARKAPEVEEVLKSGASLNELRNVEGGDEFVTQFDSFIEQFGHRATGEIDLSRQRWQDDPSMLLRTIQSNVEHGTEGSHREHLQGLQTRSRAAEDELKDRANHGLFGPVRKRIVRHLIQSYRKAIPIREFPKQGMAHAFAAIHDVLSEAGETLAANDQLDQPNDVWFLRRDEVLDALNGKSIDVDIESRRRTHERYARMTAPPLLTSEGEHPTGTQPQDSDENTLVGTAVSAGIVEGTARVVHDPSGVSLESGEILVAPSTDPGWTPLFLNAGGLVMEVGGRMTHGALVAREYGIPAVASVSNATKEIQTGERIRIDGKRGIVDFLDRTGDVESLDNASNDP